MRPKMVRRHEIQVMHAFGEKLTCLSKKFLRRNDPAIVPDRYLIILTEKALAGTTAEEDRTRSPRTRERRFFTKMRAGKRNATGCALTAKP